MPTNYWTATDDFLRGNSAPNCPTCGQPMAPEDDHGRFRCLSCWTGNDVTTSLITPRSKPIRQINTVGMADAQKAKIPVMNRLHGTPTTAEAKLLDLMLKGPAGMDDPAYEATRKAVAKERK